MGGEEAQGMGGQVLKGKEARVKQGRKGGKLEAGKERQQS